MVFAGFIVWLLNWQFIFTKHCNLGSVFFSLKKKFFFGRGGPVMLCLSLDSWFQCCDYSLKALFRHMVNGPFHKVNV